MLRWLSVLAVAVAVAASSVASAPTTLHSTRLTTPETDSLYEKGDRVWQEIVRAVGSNGEWLPLSAPQQKEMDGAIVVLQEAMAQVSGARDGAIPASALTRLYGTLHAGPRQGC